MRSWKMASIEQSKSSTHEVGVGCVANFDYTQHPSGYSDANYGTLNLRGEP